MIIYRIDTNSRTGITALEVPKEYALQAGDYTSFPAGAYTPITVGANGQLVGATLEEHEAWIKKWNAAHPETVVPQPQVTPNQAEATNAKLMLQLAQMQVNQSKMNANILLELASLKNAIKGDK